MSAKGSDPPEYLLVPIGSLWVPCEWQVGRVTFHPGDTADSLLAGTPPVRPVDDLYAQRVDQVLSEAREGCLAEVRTPGIKEALPLVGDALAALRVFKHGRLLAEADEFGLPWEVGTQTVRYLAVWDRAVKARATFRGVPAGWGFSAEDRDAWEQSPAFAFISRALSSDEPTDAERRVWHAVRFLSRAILEQSDDQKLLNLVIALGALLTKRGKSMALAQKVAWFGCGRFEGELCGQVRPVCPYLWLNPDRKKERKLLERLKVLAEVETSWLCSEWLDAFEWYEQRSQVVHGDGSDPVDDREASSAIFRVVRYLLGPICEWMEAHPDDPVGDLDKKIESVPLPPEANEMLSLIPDRDELLRRLLRGEPLDLPPELSWPAGTSPS